MNQPYVKTFNEKGEQTNKFEKEYASKVFLGTRKITDEFNQTRYVEMYYPNRRERRSMNKKQKSELNVLRTAYLKQLKKQQESLKEGLVNYYQTIKQNIKSTLGNFVSVLNKTKLA